MANKFARSNGDFNGPIWALTSGGVAGSTTAPTIGDNAIANTFTIQITGNVTCDVVHSGALYGGASQTGTFNLNDGSVLTANITPGITNGSQCVLLSGTNSAIIYGNLNGTTTASVGSIYAVNKTGNGNLTVYGNINGGSSGQINGHAVNLGGSGIVQIFGNIVAGTSTAVGVVHSSTGSVTVYGNLNGAGPTGLSNTSTGSVTVYGNLNGSVGSALSNSSTGSVTVLGNVIGDSRGGNGITSTNAAANVRISGNLIGAPNGIPAVYAASYTVNPVPYQTYIRYANNGTGVGSDAYLYHYTTDSLSAFSMPPVSAVRAGLQYANNTLTGTCQIPPVSSVTFGALVDNTSGTAILTSNNLWETSIASLTATNSVGARLKNSATVESVGRILASFTN